MIKDLRDARLVDAVPRVVAGQDWVRALSEAVGVLHERTLRYIDDSQIYTSLDTATEPVLDALAINWKVDWYDTGYSVEQKRRIIKTALTVRRLMGTVGAVKMQADAIYPRHYAGRMVRVRRAAGHFPPVYQCDRHNGGTPGHYLQPGGNGAPPYYRETVERPP